MLKFLMLVGALAVSTALAADPATERRQASLDQLRKILPPSPPWEQWLRRTGELPPDFEKQAGEAGLPDPIRFSNGKPVKREEWPRRRQELLGLFQRYVIGTLPPPPGNVRARSIASHAEAGALVDEVLLEFGPRHQATLRLELIIPRGPGPFPVFLTQDNHRGWALVAVSRGYLGAVYAGADSHDDTTNWPALWPQHDWSKLARRAWAASRCVDYLMELPVVDTNAIAVAGHSRNGKASLIAAAVDRRIAAVISSSSGAGGACSYRLFSEREFGEGIELLTRVFPDWFHPRLRFFAGREHQLPVDQPELIACIAPRACLISTALNDPVESVWAIEQTYYSARRTYELLGKPQELNLRYRPGEHSTGPGDIEAYLDWLDTAFDRGDFPVPDAAVFPTYEQWLKLSGEKIDPELFPTNSPADLLTTTNGLTLRNAEDWSKRRPSLVDRVSWGLGESPPYAESQPGDYGAQKPIHADLLGRKEVPAGLEKVALNFGNYIPGDLYLPAKARQEASPLPAVIWVHPISNPTGYAPSYRVGEQPHLALARRGIAVFAFDQIGNGTRLGEVGNFYLRYPNWSLLGKQVEDTLAAVEALGKLPYIDTNRIYVLGFGVGGMVALHATALDDRIAGVVSIAGFTPMRSAGASGGLARWTRWLPLQPRLAAFIGREPRLPYDYAEVLTLIAPRPVVIVAPQLDYLASPAAVRTTVSDAAPVFSLLGVKEKLVLLEPEDYARFSPALQRIAFDGLMRMTRE